MTIGQILKSPQMLVSALSAAVAMLGTIGILTLGQSAAVAALLTAILGVVTAFSHAAVSARIADRNAAEAVLRDRVTRTSPPAPGPPPIR